MTVQERQIAQRIQMLERQVRELQELAGLNAEALDAMRRDEAIEHMARTGDPGMIKDYLLSRQGVVA